MDADGGAAVEIIDRAKTRWFRRLFGGFLLVLAAAGLMGGCSNWPQTPTYTDAELKAICERRGGWWRGDLIAGYCEFQAASLVQSP